MPEVSLNYLAMLAAVVGLQILGFVWYSKPVFGGAWMNLIGKTEEDLKKSSPVKTMTLGLLLSILMVYVLAHFVDYTEAETFWDGIVTGVWLWVGFFFTTAGMNFLYERRPFKLFLIEAVYFLIGISLAGGILAVWA
ncbi:MAG: DUF1761 domain-containing protein [bacterium]|nr:DUF1761 domain-containing protein [bacterium]